MCDRSSVTVSQLTRDDSYSSCKSFKFSRVFNEHSTQSEVFKQTVVPIMKNVLHESSGGLIFAYGVSGSGKTFTMVGDDEQEGIIPLALRLIYRIKEKAIELKNRRCNTQGDRRDSLTKHVVKIDNIVYDLKHETLGVLSDIKLSLRAFQILDERVLDLSVQNEGNHDSGQEIKVSTVNFSAFKSRNLKSGFKSGFKSKYCTSSKKMGPGSASAFKNLEKETIITGLTEFEDIQTVEEATRIVNKCILNRAQASTNSNLTSSRSHCVVDFKLKLKHERVIEKCGRIINLAKETHICLVDLAGAEKVKKAKTIGGTNFKQTCHINTSLLNLRRCLTALRKREKVIPFRDSMLTKVLMNYLNSRYMVQMVANIKPTKEDETETLQVLEYASHSNQIILPKSTYSNSVTDLEVEKNFEEAAMEASEEMDCFQKKMKNSILQFKMKLAVDTTRMIDEFQMENEDLIASVSETYLNGMVEAGLMNESEKAMRLIEAKYSFDMF